MSTEKEKQRQRRVAIDLLNAQTRAAELEQRKREKDYEQISNRIIQPNENDVRASYAEGFNQDVGTSAGGDAFLQGSTYFSPDAAPAFSPVGGASSMDAPTGAIEPDFMEPEDELQNVEGQTDVYYDSVKKLNELAAFAASQGINIKSPDPMNEDQRNLPSNRQNIGPDGITQFSDLIAKQDPDIKLFNDSVQKNGYTEYSGYKNALDRYDLTVEKLENRAKQLRAANNFDGADKLEEEIQSLIKPFYDSIKNRELALKQKRLEFDEKKHKREFYKKKKSYVKAADIAILAANAFKNKASF